MARNPLERRHALLRLRYRHAGEAVRLRPGTRLPTGETRGHAGASGGVDGAAGARGTMAGPDTRVRARPDDSSVAEWDAGGRGRGEVKLNQNEDLGNEVP